ncbi:GNAT family N-acetyltransferase [Rossellomorea aquimaris]|uniref:GNAT family N-acetyltransferase n=1 Tax=Rossellomorea aquimaris TaxID=189382 RepID=UPI001CD2F06E|nr:GNAT family N-acetyltransferase [Rossellomorea aquimaris]MCA1057517.1 GNAT family N-acetyltransferase [Rossellomorea aquimaris]
MTFDIKVEVDRINEIELALTRFNSERALSSVDKNLQTKQVGDCTLLIDPASPGSIYYNRIKGFGKNDLDKTDEILEIYASEQLTPCFDMTPDQLNMEVAQALTGKGFYSAEQLVFMEMQPQDGAYVSEDIHLVKVTGDNVREFLHLIAESTGMTSDEEIMERKATYFVRPDFHNYIAYIGEDTIGMGSLFIRGEEGYLANDFTFPSHRGKGAQKALIHHRIQTAKEMGLKRLYTDVEFGTASNQNMLKAGFQTVFQNSFWMKAE